MRVTVEVLGGDGEVEVEVDPDATYADIARAADFHPREVSVLVDGSPVPSDQPVAADRVKLLRLVAGGDGSPAGRTP
jgi:sulfur carrier protein